MLPITTPTPITLTCTLPAGLTQSACFVNPNSMTGTGKVSLSVNSTPAHPAIGRGGGVPGWLAAGGGSLACLLLFGLPRRRKGFALLVVAALFFAGCGGGTAKVDPGTTKGAYNVVVTATAGSGSSASQTSVNVPVTLQ